MKQEHNSNFCNVQVNKKVGSGENTLCPIWNQIFIHVLAIVFCRIVFSKRGKMIPLSVLLTKAPFIWVAAAAAASDGSSPSMAPSAVVHCLLMSFGGHQALVTTATNQEQ